VLLLLSLAPALWSQSPSPSARPLSAAHLARRDKLVRAWYQRVLRRPAVDRELPIWHAVPGDREIVEAVVRSSEAQATLYREACPAYFGRPRPEGEAAWLAGHAGRKAVRNDLRRHIVGLDDFWKSCGASRSGAIDRLHRVQLGRAPTKSELAGWELACERGLTVTRLADLLAESPEGRAVRSQTLHREMFGAPAPPDAEAWIAHELTQGPEEDVWIKLLIAEPFLSIALSAK
jgi:hypothetical protein